MKKLASLLGVLAALAFPASAYADVTCDFSISALWVTPDGWVNVAVNTADFGKGWWICPVSGSTSVNDGYATRTVTSDSCKAIYSMLLTQKSSGRPIKLQFHGPASCTSSELPADGTQPNPFPANFGTAN